MGESRISLKELARLAYSGALISLTLGGIWAFAADSTATSTDAVGVPLPQMTFGPGPEFSATSTLNMGNMISSCMAQPLIGQLQMGMKNGIGGTSVGGSCPGSEGKIDTGMLECSNFESDGKFDPDKFKAIKASVDEARTNISCQRGSLSNLQNQLSCLSTQAASLQNQINTLQSNYTQGIQNAEQYVATMKGIEADRQKQYEDVQSHLQDNKDTGEKGLLTLAGETEAMINGMSKDIATIVQQHKSAQVQHTAFEENIQRTKMAEANSCFLGTTGTTVTRNGKQEYVSFQCEQNGPVVTAKEYLLCRYEQNNRLGANGTVETSNIRTKGASSQRDKLAALLDKIFASSPSMTSAPTTQEDAQKAAAQPNQVLSLADLESRYGADLASFNVGNMDIHSYVISLMSDCYKDASATVDKRRAEASSIEGRSEQAIKDFEAGTNQQVDDLLTKYAKQYSDVLSGLTGVHTPVNADGCRSDISSNNTRKVVDPVAQESCLTDLSTNLRGVWAGTLVNSTISYSIKGNNASTTINFQCQGLSGCVRKLQSLARNIQTSKNQVTTEKMKQITAFNQKVEGRTKQTATALSTENTRLANELNKINSQLTALGVRGAIKFGHVKGEQLTKDDDGLYKSPTSITGLISNYMGDPGLIDVNSGDFAESQDGIQERMRRLGEKESEVASVANQLEGKKTSCMKSELTELSKTLQDQVASLSDCYRNVEFCSDLGDGMATWERDLSQIFGSQASAISQSLRSGTKTCSSIMQAHIPSGMDSSSVATCGSYLEALETVKGKVTDAEQKVADAQADVDSAQQADLDKAKRVLASAQRAKASADSAQAAAAQNVNGACMEVARAQKVADPLTLDSISVKGLAAAMTSVGIKTGDASNCRGIYTGDIKDTVEQAQAIRNAGSSATQRGTNN